MDVRAQLKFYRQSPRKVRLVADAVRGARALEAEASLQYMNKRASGPVLKLLKSAMANAHHNHGIESDNLFVKQILVNEGPTLKRFRPRAFGRAAMLRKRSSHVLIVLSEIDSTIERKTPANKGAAASADVKTEKVADVGDKKEDAVTKALRKNAPEKGHDSKPGKGGGRAGGKAPVTHQRKTG